MQIPLSRPQLLVRDACHLNARAGSHCHAFTIDHPDIDIDQLGNILESVATGADIFQLSVPSNTSSHGSIAASSSKACRIHRGSTWAQLAELSALPLDPASPPQLKFDVHEIEGEVALVTRAHHIVLDNVSGQLALEGIGRLLSGGTLQRRDALADAQLQVAWNEERISLNSERARLKRFESMIDTMPSYCEDAATYPGIVKGAVGRLSADDTARLARLATSSWASPFLILLCTFAALIGETRGCSRVPIAIPYSTRNEIGLPHSYGNFVDYLVIDVACDDLRRVIAPARAALSAAMKGFLPVHYISQAIGISPTRLNPLLRFTASLQPSGAPSTNAFLSIDGDFQGGETWQSRLLRPAPLETRTVTLEMQELGLIVGEVNGEMRWLIGGRCDLISKEMADGMTEAIGRMLRQLLNVGDGNPTAKESYAKVGEVANP